LAEAKAALGGAYDAPEALQAAEDALAPQVVAISEALKKLMMGQRGATGEAAMKFSQLGAGVRSLQNQVDTELKKVRAAKIACAATQKNKVSDERDSVAFQEILPEATQKTNIAEDAVEKAVITSEMITTSGDDLEDVRRAVSDTEQAAQEAQKALGEARIHLNAKTALCRRFQSETVKAQAASELAKLQGALQAAQNKLNPLKNVRTDFTQRTAAQKLVQETLEKLTPAEVEVDGADEATGMLSSESTPETVQQAERAVSKASDHINVVLRWLLSKKATAAGIVREELTKLEERAKGSSLRLTQLRIQHRELTEKSVCDSVLQEAADKLKSVEETVTKAADAEGPFLMGVEDLPLEETLSAVKGCEAAVSTANTAVSIARMFIATKLVEAKRFTEKLSGDATAKLKEFQTELDAHGKRLTELKKNSAERKKSATMKEAESEVSKAEELSKQVGQAAEILTDDAKLMSLSAEEIRAASQQSLDAEKAANAALAAARKFITARQIESKGKDMSAEVASELIKYQTRLSTAQSELGKFKKLSGSVEQRLSAKRVVEEATAKLASAEEKVAKLAELVEALDNDDSEATADAEAAGTEAIETEAVADADAEGQAADAEEKPAATEGKAAGGEKKTKKGDTKAVESAAAEAQVAVKTASRFLESQTRAQGFAKEEMSKMQPKSQEVQKKLSETITAMKEKTEKLVVNAIIQESKDRVSEAEASVAKVTEAEEPFLKSDEMPIEEASKLMAELDAAMQNSHTAIGSAKTFLAMKRLAAKRLTDNSAKKSMDELTELQVRLDAVAKKMAETKKGIAERRMATAKREADSRVTTAEKKVEEACEATQALTNADSLAPEEMKDACEKAGTAQHAASACITETKAFLQKQQRDAKLIASDSSMPVELTKLLERLTKAQSDLDKQKAALRDQEHKFVAQRLLEDATQLVDDLETMVQTTKDTAEPLTSEKGGFIVGVYLSGVVAALKSHMKTENKSAKSLHEAMGEAGPVTEAKFVAFMAKLPGQSDLLSEDQLKLAFARMDIMGGGEVGEEQFLDLLRTRLMVNTVVAMTDTMAVKGGKTLRKLDLAEMVEQIEEPTKDPDLGLLRVKAKAEKDGKEGYITVCGNQGTAYLVTYDAESALERKVEQALQDLMAAGGKAQKYVETKVDELKNVHKGPLSETKALLLALGPRIREAQQARKQLKAKLVEAKGRHKEEVEKDKKVRQEAIDRQAADKIMEEVDKVVKVAEEQAERAIELAQKLAKSDGSDVDDLLKSMEAAEKDLAAVTEPTATAVAVVKQQMQLDSVKNAAEGPFRETRTALVKVKVKLGTMESRCKKQISLLAGARKQVTHRAQLALQRALRKHASAKGLQPAEVFKELSNGGDAVSAQALRKFLENIPDSGVNASQLDLGVDKLATSLSKLSMASMFQEYHRCIKDIAITTAFEVKESKTIRKLLEGEIVEVLETRKGDDESVPTRMRCRALVDLQEGWITLKGNQGTAFMDTCSKPFFCSEQEASLQMSFASSSEEVCKLVPGEVLEVLEGPRQEEAMETKRVKGKAGKDGKLGWVTLTSPGGRENLELAKLLICKQPIAITTTFDITEGKSIRKLEVGEPLELLEEPKEDAVRRLTRVKARTKNDGKEGWVTLKGNHGTSYADETDTHYICKFSVPLQKRCATTSEEIRIIEEGEVFEVVDGPKSETKEGARRVRARGLSSGSEGWFTLSATFTEWSVRYKVAQSTVLNDGIAIKDSKVIRKLEAGEFLEALDVPELEKSAGVLRARVRAEKDGATGFATIRGNKGTEVMKPVLFDSKED